MGSYIYLHGFASGPSSTKALFFRDRLNSRGASMEIPALDGGDFEHLTLSRQLTVVEQAVRDKPTVLLGSSMGAYLAALYAQNHPNVERLVLLAPAFDFHKRWAERVGADAIETWRMTNELPVFHYAQKRDTSVGFELFEDAAQFPPYPKVSQPALVLHGLQDDIVPPETSQRFREINPHAQVHFLEAGHELTGVLDPMWALVEPFLF